jgi:uroporphyrinogen decarboxylase
VPRGELFISRTFLDHYFSRDRGAYSRQLAAAALSMGLSLVGIDLNHGPSLPRPSVEALKELEPFFAVGYVDGPMERLIEAHGFVAAMKSLKKEPSLLARLAANVLIEVEEAAQAARRGGLAAMAIADDIAGNRGLLFSPDYFVDAVYPAYRDMARVIGENGLSPFFHSDGDIRKIIGSLIEAGYECIHPVDGGSGLDIYHLRAEFGDRVSFMGHVDIMTWDAARIGEEVGRAESEFALGGLILGSMGGLSMDVGPDALFALYGEKGLALENAANG